MKVYIKRYEKKPDNDVTFYETIVSVDAIKPYKVSESEWNVLRPYVEEINDGKKENNKGIRISAGWCDLYAIVDEKDWGILAESKHFYILREYEDASIYSKPDSRHIASVGDFYGEPEDAYIDPDERFCITIGCGIIKYMLREPYEGYMYDRETPQWIEVGRQGDIEWCNRIEEVTDSYVEVSLEEDDRRRFNLETLEKMQLK